MFHDLLPGQKKYCRAQDHLSSNYISFCKTACTATETVSASLSLVLGPSSFLACCGRMTSDLQPQMPGPAPLGPGNLIAVWGWGTSRECKRIDTQTRTEKLGFAYSDGTATPVQASGNLRAFSPYCARCYQVSAGRLCQGAVTGCSHLGGGSDSG